MPYTAAVIGTGADPETPDASGFAMAYYHADAYEAIDGVELVAGADIVRENVEAFANNYGLGSDGVFESHEDLLAEIDPDIVSVTVPPAVHADLAIDAIRHGVEAVHCEKPMALTYEGARTMAQEAHRRDVHLTFNHQRRFGAPFRKAKELLDAGEIGSLERVEFSAANLYDYGSHSFDLCNYFNDERSAEWVLAGLDYSEENKLFGAHNENQAVVQWEYENGVDGLATTGRGGDLVGCHNRLVGSEGVIEIGPHAVDASLRVRRDGDGWKTLDADGEGMHEDATYNRRAIESAVEALDTGSPSELCAKNALNAAELIFGAWESARVRGRIDFPLDIDDNPLEAMVEDGILVPQSADD